MNMHHTTIRLAALFVPLSLVQGASGQLLLNGDFESLTIGTPPDCATPAGAWEYPANYLTNSLCEVLPTESEIVSDPQGRGQALHFIHNNENNNVHLTNLLPSVINEEPGLIVRVRFDAWIPTGGIAGGSLYVGGDHGGGGFSNVSDRGPQLTFQPGGALVARDGATGEDVIIVPAYSIAQWQTIQLDIDLIADTFDASWGPQNGVLNVVATDVPFRSPNQNRIDRFSLAHFGQLNAVAEIFIDNVSVERTAACPCACDFDPTGAPGTCDIFDFLAFQDAFVGAEPCACDFDPTGAPGICDIFDFLAFQDDFVGGCP